MNLKASYYLQCPVSTATKIIVCGERERGREEEWIHEWLVFGKKKLKISKMLNLASRNFKAAIIAIITMFKKLKGNQKWKEVMVLTNEQTRKIQQRNKNYKKSNGYLRTKL